MASISPLSFLSTTANTSSYLLPRGRHSHVAPTSVITCNASNPNNNEDIVNVNRRRDLLIGLGGMAGAAGFAYNPFAYAAPVSPDLKACGPPTLPAGAKPVKCCPPASTNIIDFEFPKNQPLRLRKPAHKVTGDDLAKYKDAIKAMRDLPDDDPRSFTQQAAIHCAYCHNSYHQVGFPDKDLQVHYSWIFLPFHRWYIYFYERILGSLINDPTFALPFWNWDHPDGMEMPSIFTDRRSSLYDPLRNANHQPPVLVDLSWNRKGADTGGDVDANLSLMYTNFVEVKAPLNFFGQAFRAGDTPYTVKTGAGSCESVHNTLHVWSGDRTQPNGEDMGSLYSAGRDPLFYCHHSNVDRMWNLWKSFGNKDIVDPDFLESNFLFYDENKNLVRVKTKDCLDSVKLGYDYEKVPIPWAKTKPKARRTKAERAQKPLTTKSVDFPLTLEEDKLVSTVVKRPRRSRNRKEKNEREETLVLEIEFDRRLPIKFDVLLNEEEDSQFATPKNREFAGSFVNVSHTQKSSALKTELAYKIGITEKLIDLEADDDDSVVVTLVPQYGEGVVVKGIKIDYEEIAES
ncbi:hypothetical protein PIB30_016855 [Stylosanthes scabra]|uniref:Tyrosinase copper-binding domain-containing protein n=1 Tax=Stylosanthes scabra TaxID=79078 RepID=A0ABU6U6J8_9FABA|nr:hypothetical protein [Stylosanthes scabra]